ncbi:MAG: Uma2 family endonuclease [Bryobacteraceae bacterium]|nr:Uma2 family endonuclease [Bryobacteraceae bacterium]
MEDYLCRTEKPHAEYWDGEVRGKALPTSLHARMQCRVMMLLARQGKPALPELTLRMSESRYLVPDVAVVTALQSPYPTEAPNCASRSSLPAMTCQACSTSASSITPGACRFVG